ncbi:MAG: phosphoribosylglycinamide formyltransferase 1 [Actinomycetota bacterium]|jgi:phosphoribosylglycinamide formyltransferase-1|nr:phosphoribosylglycinamide formyltransferase 1 [Actinomycetota bacterium]
MDGRIAVLASGVGSNLQALMDDDFCGERVVLVVSDRPKARALERAREAGIESAVLEFGAFPDREAFSAAVVDLLRSREITHVALAGFMRIFSPVFVDAFRDRILNVHPSLLPAFPGAHSVQEAIDRGVKVTGVTVHLVTEELDGGPIVLQESIPILEHDDWPALEARINEVEHRLLPEAVRALVEGRIQVRERRATIEERHD